MDACLESVIDPQRPNLSPYVFDGNNHLHPLIRFKILRTWATIHKLSSATKVLIVGGIATYNYSAQSDIDVTICVPVASEEQLKEAKQITLDQAGKDLAGPHEINYFVRKEYQPVYFDSIYDVLANKWVRGPAAVGVNVERYMDRFEDVVSQITIDKAELLDDLADYNALRQMDDAGNAKALTRAKTKLSEVEDDIRKLGSKYKQIWSARNAAFKNPGLAELREYGRRSALPANVIYLLLRRYCYLHLLCAMMRIVQQPENPIPDAADAMSQFNTCQLKQGIDERLARL